MSTKVNKFKSLMRSPSGSSENKENIIQPPEMPKSPAHELVQISGKKKATFEFDAELHRWLKMHSMTINKSMIDVVEEQIKRYRAEVEGK